MGDGKLDVSSRSDGRLGAAEGAGRASRAWDSVGTAQLKANAVTSAKVKNGTLRAADFKVGQVPAGPKGDKGATGATGASGAVGAIGPKGDKGDSFSVATTLPSGQTERGGYSLWGGGSGGFLGTAIDFRIPLAQAIPAGNAHFIAGGAFTPQCPGYGQAAAGHACVYQEQTSGAALGGIFSQFNNSQVTSATSVNGFHLWFTVSAAAAWSYGEWAVTAA